MTAHIEQLVTEIVPRAETPGAPAQGEQQDPRWGEEEQLRAQLARRERLQRRLSARGFDD